MNVERLKDLCSKAENRRFWAMQDGDISDRQYFFHDGYRTAMQDVLGFLNSTDQNLEKVAGVWERRRGK